jgi:hypothetical protein
MIKHVQATLSKVGWMQEFRFTEYESTYIKTALIRNNSDIGYMSRQEQVFWASPDTIVLVEDDGGRAIFYSGFKKFGK